MMERKKNLFNRKKGRRKENSGRTKLREGHLLQSVRLRGQRKAVGGGIKDTLNKRVRV